MSERLTYDPSSGRLIKSPEFKELCSEVERLIRGDAFMLISGRADQTAHLIVSRLMREYGLSPSNRVTVKP